MLVKPCDDRPILNPCTLENLNYQVDPYIGCGHYCYYCYVLDQAETNWRQEIMIHKDIRNRLGQELSKIPPQTIYMGWHTDPYQPNEAKHRQTRLVLELLSENGFSASILTKSDLVLRDMELLRSMRSASVSVSVAFNHDSERQQFEANTMPTEARIAALREFKAKGIRTAALICPVIPYITDVKPLIDQLAPHTDKIWIYGLSLLEKSGPSWQNVEEILDSHYPGRKEQIEAVVFNKEHAYWSELRQELQLLREKRGLNLMIHV